MAITIISLHKDNKVFKDMEVVKKFDFQSILVSNHTDVIENLTDKMIYRLIILRERLYDITAAIKELFGVDTVCSSGGRTKKVNKLVGGSSSSQHPDFKALDLNFYINGVRTRDKDTIEMIFAFLSGFLDGMWIQMFKYSWGIHIGFVDSERLTIDKRKGNLWKH